MTAYHEDPRYEPLGPGLDAGIGGWVEVLRRFGVETFESCEGGQGHSFPEPTIRFSGGPEGGAHAYSIARVHGFPVQAIRRVWDEVDGELTGPHWEIVFWRKVGEAKPIAVTLGEAS